MNKSQSQAFVWSIAAIALPAEPLAFLLQTNEDELAEFGVSQKLNLMRQKNLQQPSFARQLTQTLNYHGRHIKELCSCLPCSCLEKYFMQYLSHDISKAGFLVWSLLCSQDPFHQQYATHFLNHLLLSSKKSG